MKRQLVAASLALALLGTVPARADFSAFIVATCGLNCPDPIGEQAAARDNWSALQAMGTTGWIGSTLGGTTLDASSLLAAARVAGASELDRWLNTGEASSTDVAQAMSDALRSDAGLDVTLITGQLNNLGAGQSQYDTTYANTTGYLYGGSSTGSSDLNTALGVASSLGSTLGGGNLGSSVSGLASAIGGGTAGSALGAVASLTGALTGSGAAGGGNGYCAQSIDQAQNANAKKYVQAMQQIATSGDYGFTQNGGKPISSGSASGSGYYKGGCLDQLMQGTRDMLFKPPGLSNLLSQLGGMFGAGGSGGSSAAGCSATPSILSQLQKSMPSSIFNAGQGGFLPAAAFGGGGLSAGSALSALGRVQGVTPQTLQSIFSR